MMGDPAHVGDVLLDALAERIASRVAERFEVAVRSIERPIERVSLGMSEAAESLGVSTRTVADLVADGTMESFTIGTRRLIPMSEVRRLGSHGVAQPRETAS